MPLALTGCARGVQLAPGPDAPDPVCAEVIQALPRELEGLARIGTTAQATVAWGTAAAPITLRCGVQPPPPTPERCLNVARSAADPGVDWINPAPGSPLVPAHAGAGAWTFISYGRSPAVEVVVPAAVTEQPGAILLDVAGALAPVPAVRHCLAATDLVLP